MAEAFNQLNFTKPFKWLVLALCVKLILYFLFILPDNNPKRKFSGPFIKSADHIEYLSPIDNLIDKGVYAMGSSVEPYAGRLPGFIFPYIVFRVVLSEKAATICLGAFILLMAVIASYVFSLLLYQLTKKRWAFVLGFLLINFVPYFWHYDWTLHTNSLGSSCLIFFFYYFYLYITKHQSKYILHSGFFLAWLILLRGFCFFYLPVVILFIYMYGKKSNKDLKSILISLFIFILPLSVFEGMWITRNYMSLHAFVPLQTSFVPGGDSKNAEYGYKSSTKYSLTKLRELIFAWGGENAWYFKESDFSWFTWSGSKLNDHKFDESIFYAGLTKDTLLALRTDIIYSYKDSLSHKEQDSIENKIAETSSRLAAKFRTDRKGYYYFYSPLKRLKNYLFRNVCQDWPGADFENSNIFSKALKLLSLSQYLFLFLILAGFPFFYYRKRKADGFSGLYLFCYCMVLANILPFMFVIPMAHFSYFIFGYVLSIPLLIFVIQKRIN